MRVDLWRLPFLRRVWFYGARGLRKSTLAGNPRHYFAVGSRRGRSRSATLSVTFKEFIDVDALGNAYCVTNVIGDLGRRGHDVARAGQILPTKSTEVVAILQGCFPGPLVIGEIAAK
jgi:hypothetical protein